MRILALFAVIAASGCREAPTANSKGSAQDRITALEKRVDVIEFDKLINDQHAAFLKPSETGYSLIETDFGRITVTLANVQPYANGSQIVLEFGNPTSARFNTIKAKIEWGETDEKGVVKDDHARSIDWSPTEPLPGGSWHKYTLNLSDIPPTRLGWVRVSDFSVSAVNLYRSN